MAEYSIVQDFNKYNTNLHNTIRMNQVFLNKESLFLIRDIITGFSESISTKNILTLEKINGKSFDKDIIEKIEDHAETIEDHASTLADYLVAINSNAGDIITMKNAQTAAAAATVPPPPMQQSVEGAAAAAAAGNSIINELRSFREV